MKFPIKPLMIALAAVSLTAASVPSANASCARRVLRHRAVSSRRVITSTRVIERTIVQPEVITAPAAMATPVVQEVVQQPVVEAVPFCMRRHHHHLLGLSTPIFGFHLF